MANCVVDVFISNYTLVDSDVYQLWVEGCSLSEAVAVLEKRGITEKSGATIDLIESDVSDHYRTYEMLEKLLHTPSKISEQLAFQLEPANQQFLIEKYYGFDDSVIRELLGKKLSSRHRKDLDEVSDKTNVSLKSCRRQFDNVKRVFKAVEEMSGDLFSNVKNTFILSDELSRKYGAVVFIACVRFETSKRKLQYLTFSDFYHCATAIMANWTYRDSSQEFDLDREFLLDLRDVRVLLDKEREHKHLVCQRLKPTLLERSYQELENNFRSYSRAIVGLACNLHRSRELRGFFVELVERCIEPWRQVSWSHTDLNNFLTAYEQCAIDIDILSLKKISETIEKWKRHITCYHGEGENMPSYSVEEVDLKAAWERYMSVVSTCLLKMFHN